jgi:hypothetical protein
LRWIEEGSRVAVIEINRNLTRLLNQFGFIWLGSWVLKRLRAKLGELTVAVVLWVVAVVPVIGWLIPSRCGLCLRHVLRGG